LEDLISRALFDSVEKEEGEITLFDNKFYYHYGLAFMILMEIFENCMYDFKINN
jgi:hypothetical protein